MKLLKNLLELSRPTNFYLLAKILVYIPFIRILLIRMEIPALLNYLNKNPSEFRPFYNTDKAFSEFAWKYSSFILQKLLKSKNPCLYRSLILFCLFRKKGLGVKIHFGIKKNVSPFEGHSWLSLNGKYFLENPDPLLLHTDIYSYPPKPLSKNI